MADYFTRMGTPIPPQDVVGESKSGCTYKYIKSCDRCGGEGYSSFWNRTGAICYKCNGVGRWPETAKGYTAEKLAALDAAATARHAKAVEKHEAKMAAEAAALLEKVHAFCAANPEVTAWLKANAKTDEHGEENFAASLQSAVWKFGALTEKQLAAVQRIIEKDKAHAAVAHLSQHVGAVKDRVVMQLTVERVLDWSGMFIKYCNVCRDEHGNAIKYVGSKALESGTYKVTIKDHEEYKGEKVTVIERPAAM